MSDDQRVLGADEQYCASCGNVIKKKAVICPKCGVKQSYGKGKSRISAALLAFFLGFIGVHKFYLGRPGQGVLYLLFFWTLIPGIIAFVEFILLLCMSDDKFDEKYNQ